MQMQRHMYVDAVDVCIGVFIKSYDLKVQKYFLKQLQLLKDIEPYCVCIGAKFIESCLVLGV